MYYTGNGAPVNTSAHFCIRLQTFLGFFVYLTNVLFFTIIIMLKNEITLDDVIEFIIRNRNDRAAMDEISKTSFPFTTKYLE